MHKKVFVRFSPSITVFTFVILLIKSKRCAYRTAHCVQIHLMLNERFSSHFYVSNIKWKNNTIQARATVAAEKMSDGCVSSREPTSAISFVLTQCYVWPSIVLVHVMHYLIFLFARTLSPSWILIHRIEIACNVLSNSSPRLTEVVEKSTRKREKITWKMEIYRPNIFFKLLFKIFKLNARVKNATAAVVLQWLRLFDERRITH